MLASFQASMLKQKPSDLGILNRFKLNPSRSSALLVKKLGLSRLLVGSNLASATPRSVRRPPRWPDH